MASAPCALLKTPIVSTETSPDRRPVSPAVSFARQARYRIADESVVRPRFSFRDGAHPSTACSISFHRSDGDGRRRPRGRVQFGRLREREIATQHVMAGLGPATHDFRSDIAVQRRRSPEQIGEDAGNWSTPMNGRRSSSQPTRHGLRTREGLPRGSGGGASSHPIAAAHRLPAGHQSRFSTFLTPPLPIRSSPVRSCGLWCRHWQSGANNLT